MSHYVLLPFHQEIVGRWDTHTHTHTLCHCIDDSMKIDHASWHPTPANATECLANHNLPDIDAVLRLLAFADLLSTTSCVSDRRSPLVLASLYWHENVTSIVMAIVGCSWALGQDHVEKDQGTLLAVLKIWRQKCGVLHRHSTARTSWPRLIGLWSSTGGHVPGFQL